MNQMFPILLIPLLILEGLSYSSENEFTDTLNARNLARDTVFQHPDFSFTIPRGWSIQCHGLMQGSLVAPVCNADSPDTWVNFSLMPAHKQITLEQMLENKRMKEEGSVVSSADVIPVVGQDWLIIKYRVGYPKTGKIKWDALRIHGRQLLSVSFESKKQFFSGENSVALEFLQGIALKGNGTTLLGKEIPIPKESKSRTDGEIDSDKESFKTVSNSFSTCLLEKTLQECVAELGNEIRWDSSPEENGALYHMNHHVEDLSAMVARRKELGKCDGKDWGQLSLYDHNFLSGGRRLHCSGPLGGSEYFSFVRDKASGKLKLYGYSITTHENEDLLVAKALGQDAWARPFIKAMTKEEFSFKSFFDSHPRFSWKQIRRLSKLQSIKLETIPSDYRNRPNRIVELGKFKKLMLYLMIPTASFKNAEDYSQCSENSSVLGVYPANTWNPIALNPHCSAVYSEDDTSIDLISHVAATFPMISVTTNAPDCVPTDLYHFDKEGQKWDRISHSCSN